MAAAKELTALAAQASQTVVAAAATDSWGNAKDGLVRLLARGDPDRTSAVERRLDQAREQLASVTGTGLETAWAEQAAAWEARFADLLEEASHVAAELRVLVGQVQAGLPAGTAPAAGYAVAAGRDLNVTASGGGVAAGTIHGGVTAGNSQVPGTVTPLAGLGTSISACLGSVVAAGGIAIGRADIHRPGPATTMRTLPRDVVGFTGRDAELGSLISAAAGAAGVVAVHAVDGMPGVGKTALVTRAAHLLARDFPDGQLFVGLHAHTPGVAPADPAEVLGGLLAWTGMAPREIPAGLEARAQRWRGRLAGKKVLLVLDDAAGHSQVEALLPGAGGCLVLVTSRRRLIALPGAHPLALDTLPPGEAAELFTRLSGRAADGLDTAALADLVALCGWPSHCSPAAWRTTQAGLSPIWPPTSPPPRTGSPHLPPETAPTIPRSPPRSRCPTGTCPPAGSVCSASSACTPAPRSTPTPRPPWLKISSARPARTWTPCTTTTFSTSPPPAAIASTTSSASTPAP
jgi:hypothetical protein